MKQKDMTRRLITFGLATALVAVTTMAIRIPNPFHGYSNLGDSMIFALALLGGPSLAAVAGGLGSAMADMLGGYPQWILPTLLVKGLEGLIAGIIAGNVANRLKDKIVLTRAIFGLVVAGLWMVFGYYITARILYGAPAALANIPADLVQAAINIPLGILLAWFIGKARAKV